MAISPPSDIVLDVARAADPARLQLAVDRLQKLGNGIARHRSGWPGRARNSPLLRRLN